MLICNLTAAPLRAKEVFKIDIVAFTDRADHIDLNFGCPVPKVTRRGGGAALPWRSGLFADVVSAAVRAAGGPEIDRRKIFVPDPIKAAGTYKVQIRLHPEVTASVGIEVTGA